MGAVAFMEAFWKILLPIPAIGMRCLKIEDWCGHGHEMTGGIFGEEGRILSSAVDAEDAIIFVFFLGEGIELIVLGAPYQPVCLLCSGLN